MTCLYVPSGCRNAVFCTSPRTSARSTAPSASSPALAAASSPSRPHTSHSCARMRAASARQRSFTCAPRHHSRKDWIGIYRVGANASALVTRTSSLGMWVPVHDDEWDGDIPRELQRPARVAAAGALDVEEGEVVEDER